MASAPNSPIRSSISPQLARILTEFQSKEAAQHKSPPTSPEVVKARLIAPEELTVLLMGVTGSGKSTFIKRVTEDESIIIGRSMSSETREIQKISFATPKANFCLVDTPGFNDTFLSDNDILKLLADWLEKSYRDGTKIRGIIYLHRISDPRMEGSALRSLRMFRRLCGDGFLKNVVLGTTFWDTVGEETGIRRETELLETEGFFKDMKELGCEVVRIQDNRESNIELLEKFVEKRASILCIQRELLDGKSLAESAAASAINAELAEIQQRNVEKLGDIKHQTERRMTKSALEMALKRKLEERKFEKTMEDLEGKKEEIRQEGEAEVQRQEQQLSELRTQQARQNQGFQISLNELTGQLEAMKAKMQTA
ncbi:hypothetical protein TWF694_006503 [Orbilia ellipsospora]|uniref:G domain-containing protein n=1 Tax=Orbilia ellipsospora TaxID=2528407 RepID=A0AAV9XKC1_9PEZI